MLPQSLGKRGWEGSGVSALLEAWGEAKWLCIAIQLEAFLACDSAEGNAWRKVSTAFCGAASLFWDNQDSPQ